MLPFAFGFALWDPPLPDVVDDLQALHDAHRFRFANDLRAWVEVDDDGRITDAGYAGGSYDGEQWWAQAAVGEHCESDERSGE